MNMSISQTSPAYYTALLRYNKILDQRNVLLKNRDVELILDTLPVWGRTALQIAAVIVRKRAEFLEKLAPYAKELHAFLTDGAEELVISPEKKYEGEEGEIAEKLKVIDHDDYYTVTPDLPPFTLGGGWSVDLNSYSGKF